MEYQHIKLQDTLSTIKSNIKYILFFVLGICVLLLSFFFYQNSDSVKIKEAIKTINTLSGAIFSFKACCNHVNRC